MSSISLRLGWFAPVPGTNVQVCLVDLSAETLVRLSPFEGLRAHGRVQHFKIAFGTLPPRHFISGFHCLLLKSSTYYSAEDGPSRGPCCAIEQMDGACVIRCGSPSEATFGCKALLIGAVASPS